jgi:hypothetical protein
MTHAAQTAQIAFFHHLTQLVVEVAVVALLAQVMMVGLEDLAAALVPTGLLELI